MKRLLFLLLLSVLLTHCQNNIPKEEAMNEPEYEWGISVNAPIGYPVHVYAGKVGPQYIIRELWCSTEEPDWGKAHANE